MIVEFKKKWFSPEGELYKAGKREVKESLKSFLPPSAVILGKDAKADIPEIHKEAPKTLAEAGGDIKTQKAVNAAIAKKSGLDELVNKKK